MNSKIKVVILILILISLLLLFLFLTGAISNLTGYSITASSIFSSENEFLKEKSEDLNIKFDRTDNDIQNKS